MIAVQRAGVAGWSPALTWGLFAGSIVALVLLFIWERRRERRRGER